MSPLALLAQGAADTGTAPQPFDGSLSSLFDLGPVGILVLLILLFFMASAMAIVVERVLYLRRAREETRRFLAVFRRSSRFSEVKGACSELRRSPLVGLFLAGTGELNYQLRGGALSGGSGSPAESALDRPALRSMEAISRALQRASSVEVAKLERGVAFLATTASATPFIGLLGTVIGIMNAFIEIGKSGSAGLAVVAPGIAEALINTAAGLFAAIPALIGYNFLVTHIKRLAAEMDDFSLEFLSIAERSFHEQA